MQNVFEKIMERVCEFVHERNKSGSVPCKNQRASCLQLIRVCDLTTIVNQVADEYNQSLAHDGWIPCSSGKMPENGRRCWVTYEWANGSLHVDKDYLVNGKWFETKDEAVKAWMYNDEETPEPYQPKGDKS